MNEWDDDLDRYDDDLWESDDPSIDDSDEDNYDTEDDSWHDADTFTSIGWGTDEDYGYYGHDLDGYLGIPGDDW